MCAVLIPISSLYKTAISSQRPRSSRRGKMVKSSISHQNMYLSPPPRKIWIKIFPKNHQKKKKETFWRNFFRNLNCKKIIVLYFRSRACILVVIDTDSTNVDVDLNVAVHVQTLHWLLAGRKRNSFYRSRSRRRGQPSLQR